MNWKELLQQEMTSAYRVAQGLFELVDEKHFYWKPVSGSNWLTVGQLLTHIACGTADTFKGFITGEWPPMPATAEGEEQESAMLPPAESFPTVSSLQEAKEMLEKDRQAVAEWLQQVDEERLDNEPAPAPWDPTPVVLGYRLLQMIQHLVQHKGQLFYYLKLQGKPVHTGHLWGM